MPVFFYFEKTRFRLPHPIKTSNWIKLVIRKEGFRLSNLNIVFCNDDFLLSLNRKYLKHQTLTDILTFDYRNSGPAIEGEIYISVTRVRENSRMFKTRFDDELHRVLIHGVLHLMGYDDKTLAQKAKMRDKEEACLSLR